jgi:hypothetical protein
MSVLSFCFYLALDYLKKLERRYTLPLGRFKDGIMCFDPATPCPKSS